MSELVALLAAALVVIALVLRTRAAMSPLGPQLGVLPTHPCVNMYMYTYRPIIFMANTPDSHSC